MGSPVVACVCAGSQETQLVQPAVPGIDTETKVMNEHENDTIDTLEDDADSGENVFEE